MWDNGMRDPQLAGGGKVEAGNIHQHRRAKTHEPSPLTTRLIRKDREKKKEFEKRAQKKSPPKKRKMVVL